MLYLCDVNLLLALVFEEHVAHRVTVEWSDARENDSLILCRPTQVSLLRLLSNRAIMGEKACAQKQAWEVYDALIADPRFVFRGDEQTLESHFRKLTQQSIVAPKLWHDAYLAAYCLAHGWTMATLDSGFREFPGLAVELLVVHADAAED